MEYTPMCDTHGGHDIVRGYLDCAKWIGLEETDREALELSARPKWSEESKLAARTTVQGFVDLCVERGLPSPYDDAHSEHYRIGMDLWLTRNRHGSGFWDGDYAEGAALTEIAHTFGEACVAFDADSETLTLVE